MKRFLCKSVSGRFAPGTTVIRSRCQLSFLRKRFHAPFVFVLKAVDGVRSQLNDGVILSCVCRIWIHGSGKYGMRILHQRRDFHLQPDGPAAGGRGG